MATRMQQRRGTASQWTSSNPILNAGELGWESDTNKFKVGDGTNHWADLSYFVDADTLIDGAPGLLDTLNELAAALGDDPAFFTTVATNLSNHQSDTTSIHGIADTAELATKTFAAELLTNATKSNIIITGNKDGLTITAENGVADSTTDNLTEGSTNKYFTDERAQDAVGNAVGTGLTYTDATGEIKVTPDTYDAYGSASTVAGDLSTHASDTTTHGTTGDIVGTSDTQTLTNKTLTSPKINENVELTATATELNILDGATLSTTELNYVDGVTSSIQTQIDAKASSTDLSNHENDTTNIHGIADTSLLATQAYVDAATAGLNVHDAVKAATTANITLASDVENGDTLDGVTLSTGDRILVKNQTTKSQNGVYTVAASGAPSRSADYNSTPEVDAGDFIFVQAGTVNGKTGWVQTNTITTIGSDDIEFTQFSGAGTYLAGNGLTLTGTTFSINTGTTVDLSTAQTLTNKTLTSPTITGTGAIAGTFTGNITGNVTGNVSGNAGTVTNGVYTTDTGTVTNTMLAGSIANNKLANSSVTVGTTAISLGSSSTTLAGITTINSTTIPTSKTLVVTTDKLSALAATSSSELAGVISDETGSGALVFANSPALVTPDLGTPSALTLTNATGLPVSGITASTTTALGVGSIELGHATDTTLSRAAAGRLAVEGVNVVTISSTDTLTNKTLTSPTINSATSNNLTLTGTLTASSSAGTSGQVLASTGTGVQWTTPAAGAAFSELMLIGA